MILLAKRLGDITIDDVLLFLLCFGIVGIISWIVVIKKHRDTERENDAQPIQGMVAKIVDMENLDTNTYASRMWVLFEGNDGNRVRIYCPVKNDFIIGDKGFVKWQGNKMLSFERGKNASSITRIMHD